MIETYSTLTYHGEQLDIASSSRATRVENVEPIVDPNEQVMDILNDAFPFASTSSNQEGEDDVPTSMDSADFEQYEKLLQNANQELYLGCENFFVLTAIVELMHGKIKYRMSNLCFDYLLGVFKRMLSMDNCLPKDHRQAQKEKRVDDDVMQHPADGEAWKEFNQKFPEFAADPRNVRLGLATDGFNPYGVLNQHHSTWPIFVFPYNLPPWKCMKKEYMMMTVLITEDPGRSIDVYLWPLVDELKDLWTNGVRTYNKSTGKMFTLRAAIMWTVNDFPAYAMVSRWSTKGYMACPICKEDVTS
ncbi:unnamed protein product, partial [Prunus brigantina]